MKGLFVAVSALALATASPLEQRANTCKKGAKPPYGALTNSACPCWQWYDIQYRENDCDLLAKKFNISKADFIKWNPDVAATVDGVYYDCINIWAQQQVCVGM